MKNYKEKIEKILDYYESDGSNITYKKTEADLFSLMLDFAEECKPEKLDNKKLETWSLKDQILVHTGYKLALDSFSQRIEELRKGK